MAGEKIGRDMFLRNSQPTKHVNEQVVYMLLWRHGAAAVFNISAFSRAGCVRGRVRCRLHYGKY